MLWLPVPYFAATIRKQNITDMHTWIIEETLLLDYICHICPPFADGGRVQQMCDKHTASLHIFAYHSGGGQTLVALCRTIPPQQPNRLFLAVVAQQEIIQDDLRQAQLMRNKHELYSVRPRR